MKAVLKLLIIVAIGFYFTRCTSIETARQIDENPNCVDDGESLQCESGFTVHLQKISRAPASTEVEFSK